MIELDGGNVTAARALIDAFVMPVASVVVSEVRCLYAPLLLLLLLLLVLLLSARALAAVRDAAGVAAQAWGDLFRAGALRDEEHAGRVLREILKDTKLACRVVMGHAGDDGGVMLHMWGTPDGASRDLDVLTDLVTPACLMDLREGPCAAPVRVCVCVCVRACVLCVCVCVCVGGGRVCKGARGAAYGHYVTVGLFVSMRELRALVLDARSEIEAASGERACQCPPAADPCTIARRGGAAGRCRGEHHCFPRHSGRRGARARGNRQADRRRAPLAHVTAWRRLCCVLVGHIGVPMFQCQARASENRMS